jgi:transcriptional regulator with XRE-family HTH domain
MNPKFIKKLRTNNGYSQDYVAKKIGLGRNSYMAVEQGKRELCLGEVEALSKLYRISISDLVTNNKKKQQKYEQMLFTFLRALDGDKKVPKTKLAKLLYLSDFTWFYFHHESMSGLEYRKIEHGPVPDYYFRLLEELDGDGKIKIESKDRALLISETRVGEKVGDDLLSRDEKNLIKKISANWKDKSTKEIVDFAHSQIPYTFVDKGEIIPYELITQEEPEHVY